MIPCRMARLTQLFESIQPWDESLLINQDGEYFTRAIVASNGVIFEPQSRVYYRSEMHGSVSQFKPHKAPSLFASVESFEQAVLQLGNDSAIKTLISNQYMGFIYRVYPLVPELRKKARAKIKHYGKPTRQNDVAESAVAKLLCSIFGWKFFVQLRIIRTRLKLLNMSRILIITPKQPSGNPRMRKAADALATAGNTVHVLYAFNATGPPKQTWRFWRKPNGHGNELEATPETPNSLISSADSCASWPKKSA